MHPITPLAQIKKNTSMLLGSPEVSEQLGLPEVSGQLKETTSQELKNGYLQKMLCNYRQKYEYFRKKNEELALKLSQCKQQLCQKDAKIQEMGLQMQKYTLCLQKLQKTNIHAIGQITNQRKVVNTHEIEQIRAQQQSQKFDKMHKILTTENQLLVTSNTQLKKQIQLLRDHFDEVLIDCEGLRRQQKLLSQMNGDLKLEIEDLLFQLKTLHKRKQSSNLSKYEAQLEERQYMKELQDYRKDEQSEDEENVGQNAREIIDLLQQRIKSLQHQLLKSEERCKNLQTIILSFR